MSSDDLISREEFLSKKRDFSQLLVHLTKDSDGLSAKAVLDKILDDKMLIAYNHFCLFSPSLSTPEYASLQNKFRVVCFTETPIDQIELLTKPLEGRRFKLKPYGLVFKKKYVRERKGNLVFYANKEIASPLWSLYWPLRGKSVWQSSDKQVCKLLALVTLCDESSDWHWEREWRIVGNLRFKLSDVYCGLCPEEEVSYFENKYEPVKFIDPKWGVNQIIDKLVGK